MSTRINKTLILQGSLTFVAAIACSDAVREITSVMKRDTVYENAVLKTVIAGIIILAIIFISGYYSREDSDDEKSHTELADENETAHVEADANVDATSANVDATSANVVMKQSTLPDEAVMETYTNRDYSEYLSTFI